jgi:hypothetical protein
VDRLTDHDLLLWDADADVIIDVLPDARPRSEAEESEAARN